MSDIDTLVKMANQIAANFSFHDDQVARTADHIKRFWAPPMRKKLQAHARANPDDLDDAVLEALKQLEG